MYKFAVAFLPLLLALLTPMWAQSTPQVDDTEDHTETTTGTTPSETTESQNTEKTSIHVTSLHINSTIKWRYATTVVTSKIINTGEKSGEAFFTILLPDEAFISNFSIQVKNETYHAYVKEKEEAKKVYEEAVSLGQSAGHVAQTSRNSNRFSVAVNVESLQKMTFVLIYEELLKRKVGLYEHFIDINPGGIVDHLDIDVSIEETRNITVLKVPEIRNEVEIKTNETENPLAVTKIDGTTAHVSFSPNRQQQKEISQAGVTGQFVVQYDIDRHIVDGGDIQVVNGYFVHFFAPPVEKVISKYVVFVIDISGSMYGRKMEQTKEAMVTFLKQLRRGDLFNIIFFSSDAESWTVNSTYEQQALNYFSGVSEDKPASDIVSPIPVSNSSIDAAVEYVNKVEPTGGTNINLALVFALNHSKNLREEVNDANIVPLIIFLTDGEPTEGVTGGDEITNNTRQTNSDSEIPIFSLAFGEGADLELLKKISLQNHGFARKVYEASDATLQLEHFYEEISSPLLSQINITYLAHVEKESLTKTTFKSYFKGSEIVVVGKLDSNDKATKLESEIEATTREGDIELRSFCVLPPPRDFFPEPTKRPDSFYGNFLERMWAYLTIKELLDRELALDSIEKKNATKEQALALSLKYNFVTPLTSMVVVKPDDHRNESSSKPSAEDAEEEVDLTSADRQSFIPPPGGFMAGIPASFGGSPFGGLGGGFGGAPVAISSYQGQPGPPGSYFNTYQIRTTPKFQLNVGMMHTTTMDFDHHLVYMGPESTQEEDFFPGVLWTNRIFNESMIEVNGTQFELNIYETDVLVKTCLASGESSECIHINSCNSTMIKNDYEVFLDHLCVMDSLQFTSIKYAGVCCYPSLLDTE